MLDDTTRDYVVEVHKAFPRKAEEIAALRTRLEPAQPRAPPPRTKRPPAVQEVDERTRIHVDYRYDVGLANMRGYPYNPRRAYFQRDSQGLGQLLFEPGISLLLVSRHTPGQGQLWEMPDPSGARLGDPRRGDDRWWAEWRARRGLPAQLPSATAEGGAVARGADSRMARVDAFFAMFEQRQALTQFVGMAPICAFVGERFEDLRAHRARYPAEWKRPSPRPEGARIAQHRYQRFCVSLRLNSPHPGGGPLVCVVLAQRKHPRGAFQLRAFVSEWPSDPYDPDMLAGRARIDPNTVMREWNRLAVHRDSAHLEYPVFDEPLQTFPQTVEESGLRIVHCPHGDGELLFRVGLVLESPELDYAPWDYAPAHSPAPPPLRSLGALLRAAPTDLAEFRDALAVSGGGDDDGDGGDGGAGAGAEQRVAWLWMRYVLMLRCYPYCLLAHHDMRRRLGYRAYEADVPLNAQEVARFEEAIEAGPDTGWIDVKKVTKARAYNLKRARLAPKPPPANARLPSVASDGAIRGVGRPQPAGALTRSSRRTSRRVSMGGAGDVPGLGKIDRCRVRAATQTSARLAEARFMAIRCVEDVVGHRDPLYVAQEFSSSTEADDQARKWRQAIFQHVRSYSVGDFAAGGGEDLPDVLWMLGAQALDWLYGEGGGAMWAASFRASTDVVPRAGWYNRMIETVNPQQAINKQPLTEAMYRTMLGGSGGNEGPPDSLPIKEPDKRTLLHAIVAQLAPYYDSKGDPLPRPAYETKGDFRTMMAAVVLSLLKDAMLFIAPSPEHYIAMDRGREFIPEYTPTNLAAAIRKWLRRHRETLEKSLEAFWSEEHARVMNPLGTLAILAWEWGLWEGLRRYLRWVDALWIEEFGERTRIDRHRVSNRLIRKFDIIAQLVVRHTGRRTFPEDEDEKEAVLELEKETPKSARSSQPERIIDRKEPPEERTSLDYDTFEELSPGTGEDGSVKEEGEEDEEGGEGSFPIPLGATASKEVEAKATAEYESALEAEKARVRELEDLLEFVEGVHGYPKGRLESAFKPLVAAGKRGATAMAMRDVEQVIYGVGEGSDSSVLYVAASADSRPSPVQKSIVTVIYRPAQEGSRARPSGAEVHRAPRGGASARAQRRRKRWSVDAVDSAMARLRALRHHRTASRSQRGAWDI